MVGALSGLWVSLGGVSDYPEGRLVGCDLYALYVLWVLLRKDGRRILTQQIDNGLDGTC